MAGKLTQKNGRRYAGGKPIPKSSFGLPAANGGQGAYPLDTIGRARNALSRVAQYGTPDEKAKVRRAVAGRYKQIGVSGMSHSHANGWRRTVNLADGELSDMHTITHQHGSYGTHSHDCSDDHPGYGGDNADNNGAGTGGTAGVNGVATPQPQVNSGRTGFRGQQVTVRTANPMNGGIELAKRLPVRSGSDVIVSRQPGGNAVIRHRQGGNQIGDLKRNGDGTWQAVLDGRELSPHRMERAALMEMLGAYNTGTVSAERPAMPLQQPPAQPELFSQLGVTNVRAFAYDPDNDDDDDDSTDGGDTDKDAAGGLNPKGQGIYKKLRAKGVAPAVALAMAKRSQDARPGSFGSGS